jgi:hypothetical protein
VNYWFGRCSIVPDFRKGAISYWCDANMVARAQLARSLGVGAQRVSRQGVSDARPHRLRVRYERAGGRPYSAAAAGGAKMTPPSDRPGTADVQVWKADEQRKLANA